MSDFLLFNKILCLYQGLNNIECEKTLMWCFFLSCYCLMIHTLNMIFTFSTNTMYCLCHTQYLTKIIEKLIFKTKNFTLLQRIEVVLFNFNVLKVFISMGLWGASYIRLFRKLSYPNVHILQYKVFALLKHTWVWYL